MVKTTQPAPAKGAPTAPAKGAPTVATVATATVALAIAPNCCNGGKANGTPAAAVAVATGNVCTVASMGTVWHMVALHTAPTTGSNPAAWPPQYTSNGGTVARKPGAPQGASGLPYCTHAVVVPATGPAVWGMVHVYPAGQHPAGSAKASNPGNGSMVVLPAPLGARCGGLPCTATVALAKRLGLGAS